MINRLIALIICSYCFAVLGGEKVDELISVGQTGSLEIDNPHGQVQIFGWDKNQIQIQGELSEQTQDFIIEKRGNTVTVQVKLGPPTRFLNYSETGSHLTVYMPHRHKLKFSGINSSVSVEELHADARVNTINGAIDASNLSDHVYLESVNGSIRGEKLSGRVKVTSVNGSIELDHSGDVLAVDAINGSIDIRSGAADFSLTTVSGEADLQLHAVHDADIETVNGEMVLALSFASDDSRVSFSNVSGSAKLYVDADASIRFRIDSHLGGQIDNQLSDDVATSVKYNPARQLNFEFNGNANRVNVSTMSGRILLKKK